MKQKKAIAPLAIIIIIAVAVVATGLFLFPFSPHNPPLANDTGSTPQGAENVVDANNQFAFELYQELLKTNDGNMFYSPYSISSALAMTYEGAKGRTADEMKAVFHFPAENVLRPNFAAIYNEINKADKSYQLNTGNALWVQQDYPFLADYINTVETYYGGKAAGVDFVNEPEKSRQTINSFIEEQTNSKIKDLIPEGVINDLTRLVLTNAIYFKGTWEWQFDKSDTREQDFKITPENIVKVPMMYMDPEKAAFNYADLKEEGLQILEMPYKGDEISMLILLPKQGVEHDSETREIYTYNYTLADIEKNLNAEKLGEYKSQMAETSLDEIYLPKFEFDKKYSMVDTLSDLGMPTAFSGSANFSGMTEEEELYISKVIHQAYVKVDEEGTEAAAATAVIMEAMSSPPTKVFRADHPFIFIIQQKDTGNILFLGKVVDPSA